MCDKWFDFFVQMMEALFPISPFYFIDYLKSLLDSFKTKNSLIEKFISIFTDFCYTS